MASSSAFPIRFFGAALYLVAVLVIVDQLGELLIALRPWELGSAHWRFGAFGLATGRVTILVLVDGLLVIAAALRGNLLLLRIWAVVHILVGLALAAALVMFALDAVEIRGTVVPERLSTFVGQAARAGVMSVLSIVFCLWFGVATLLASRGAQASKGLGIVIPTRDG